MKGVEEVEQQTMTAVEVRQAVLGLNQKNFTNIKITGDLRNVDLSECTLSNIDLTEAQIDSTTILPPPDEINNVRINQTQFDILVAQGRTNFAGFEIMNLQKIPQGISGITINASQFSSLFKQGRRDFSGFILQKIDLSSPDTKQLTLINADIRGCKLSNDNLPPPEKLHGAKIDTEQFYDLISQGRTDFTGFNLQSVDLLNAPKNLNGLKISTDQFYLLVSQGRKDFRGFDLGDVDLLNAPKNLQGLKITANQFHLLVENGRKDFSGFHYEGSERVTIDTAQFHSVLIRAGKNITNVQVRGSGIVKDISDNTLVRVDIRGISLRHTTLPPPQNLDGLMIDNTQFWQLRSAGVTDFSGFDLSKLGLKSYDFSFCRLNRTDLRGNELSNERLPPPEKLQGAIIDTKQFFSLVEQGRKDFSGFNLQFVDLLKAPNNLRGIRIDTQTFNQLIALGRKNFSGFDLHGFDFSGRNLSQFTFHHANFRGAIFDKNTKLPDVTKMQNVKIDRAGAESLTKAEHTNFSYFNFQGARLSLDLSNCIMNNADLRGASFDEKTKLPDATNMKNALLDRAAVESLLKIGHKDFSQFNLRGVDLTKLPLTDCKLPPADNLRGVSIDQNAFDILVAQGNRDFRMFNLQNLDLTAYAHLMKEFLFDGADLRGTKLPNNLTGAHFADADLRGHPLSTYNLAQADIRGLRVNPEDTAKTNLVALKAQTVGNYQAAFANTDDLATLVDQVESLDKTADKSSLLITVTRSSVDLFKRSQVKGESYEKVIQAAQERAIEISNDKEILSTDDIANLEKLSKYNVNDQHRDEYKKNVEEIKARAVPFVEIESKGDLNAGPK